MAPPSHNQVVWRGRIEAMLRVVGPLLDLVLAGGERISKAVERDELEAPAPPRTVSSSRPSRRRVGRGDAA
ncbi:MAG: hypothetical protein M3P44_07985 [Actinomycetota bacterium]|nr:hypothetical protein [Actinomycetota bacterium]